MAGKVLTSAPLQSREGNHPPRALRHLNLIRRSRLARQGLASHIPSSLIEQGGARGLAPQTGAQRPSRQRLAQQRGAGPALCRSAPDQSQSFVPACSRCALHNLSGLDCRAGRVAEPLQAAPGGMVAAANSWQQWAAVRRAQGWSAGGGGRVRAPRAHGPGAGSMELA